MSNEVQIAGWRSSEVLFDELTTIFPGQSEMARQMRARNWLDTPLGAPKAWPLSLKIVIRILLTSRYAMWMAWGPELIFFCNDAYKPTLGVKQGWALGLPATKVWEEIWPDIGPRIQTVFDTGTATWDEKLLLFLERSGHPEETYHTFSYSPVPGDDGTVAGMLCVVTEETERVIGERRLATVRALATALASLNRESEVLAAIETELGANQYDLPFTLTYLFEKDGKEARLACNTGLVVPHAAAPLTFEIGGENTWPVNELLAHNVPVTVEGLDDRFDDLPAEPWELPPKQAVLLPIAAQGDLHPAGFLVAGLNPYRPFDTTYAGFVELVAGQIAAGLSNARAYDKERQRAEALAEIDRAKTLFFSNVSHEFRTPITLMLGPIEDALNDLSDSALNDVQRARLNLAHRNSKRLLRLVNTLLDFSRFEAKRVQANYQPTDLAAVTQELVSNFRSVTEKAGLKLHVSCPPLFELVYVDREMWEKVVLNLLSNAFKFTFEGEIAVTLGVTADGNSFELTVRDTGVGIPASELPRMFERFHRVENQKSRSFEGSGIGLALVQEIVQLHHGSIDVESELGKGSAFIVSIPKRGADISPDPQNIDTAASSSLASAFVEEALRWLPEKSADHAVGFDDIPLGFGDVSNATDAAIRPRILIADDNQDMREYLQQLLNARFDVEVVANGKVALESAKRNPPDIVLSDVMMPHLDGFEFLKAIRADERLRELPFILLSARAGEEAKIEGLNAGADDYLVKPFSAPELIARVQTNLHMAKVRKEAQEALRKRTTELETVLETIPTAVWFTYDRDAKYIMGNRHAAMLLRMLPEVELSLSAIDNGKLNFRVYMNGQQILPDAHPIQRAARGEMLPEEELELRFDDGTAVNILTRAAPLQDAVGNIHGAVCAAVDITERKRSEDQRTLLINELNHRVKNTLATVQSIAMQTLRNTERSADARELFEARLAALSRAHDTLTDENWESASLHDVVSRSLEPFSTTAGRLQFNGPTVRLSPKQALALAMALHELATNAVKYGAMSNSSGQVQIDWAIKSVNESAEVELVWTESGGPPVKSPDRRGFGSRLIERGLVHDLGGEATIEFRREGVVAIIRTSLQPAVE